MTIIDAILATRKVQTVKAIILTDDIKDMLKDKILTIGQLNNALHSIERGINPIYIGDSRINVLAKHFGYGKFQITMSIDNNTDDKDLEHALTIVSDHSDFSDANADGYLVELDIYNELTTNGQYLCSYDYAKQAILINRNPAYVEY